MRPDKLLSVKRKLKYRSSESMAKRVTRSRFGNVVLFVVLVAAGIFSVLPLVYSVCTAFKPLDELLIFPPRFFVHRPTLSNFLVLPDLLASLKVPLSRYFFNSIFVSVVTTFLYIILSVMMAFGLSKGRFKGRVTLFWIIQFALMFNATVLNVPQYLIITKLEIIDTYWVYILPQLASTLGVFLAKQYIDGYVSDAFLEAAKMDGANYFRIFWTIVMPMIKPAWLTLMLFGFRDIWSIIPNGTIFTEQLKTLPQIVGQITAGGIARQGSSMAVTVIMMIPPILVFLISQSNVLEAMSSAGIKE